MVKNFLVATAIMASSVSVAFANSTPYVGAGLGIATNTSSSVATGVINGVVQNSPGNFRGVPFNVFAGYGGVVNQNFYLAGEVNGTIGTAELSNNNGLKTSYGYGVSIIPGVMLSDHTLAYGRLGVVRSRFTNANNSQTGGQFGVGLQTCVTQNVDIRGEYDFTAYRSLNNSIGRVSSPRQDAFNLGLIYKFD